MLGWDVGTSPVWMAGTSAEVITEDVDEKEIQINVEASKKESIVNASNYSDDPDP